MAKTGALECGGAGARSKLIVSRSETAHNKRGSEQPHHAHFAGEFEIEPSLSFHLVPREQSLGSSPTPTLVGEGFCRIYLTSRLYIDVWE